MTQTDDEWIREQAELTVDNAECAAQQAIEDAELRASFIRNIEAALRAAIFHTKKQFAHLLDPTQGPHIDDDKPYGGRDDRD